MRLGDLRAQQQAAGAGLGALADGQLDGVGLAHVMNVDAVARGQHLVDQRPWLFSRSASSMPPSPVVFEEPTVAAALRQRRPWRCRKARPSSCR